MTMKLSELTHQNHSNHPTAAACTFNGLKVEKLTKILQIIATPVVRYWQPF